MKCKKCWWQTFKINNSKSQKQYFMIILKKIRHSCASDLTLSYTSTIHWIFIARFCLSGLKWHFGLYPIVLRSSDFTLLPDKAAPNNEPLRLNQHKCLQRGVLSVALLNPEAALSAFDFLPWSFSAFPLLFVISDTLWVFAVGGWVFRVDQ